MVIFYFFQFWTLLLEHVCFMKIMMMTMTEPRLSQAKVKKPVQKNEKKEKKFKKTKKREKVQR